MENSLAGLQCSDVPTVHHAGSVSEIVGFLDNDTIMTCDGGEDNDDWECTSSSLKESTVTKHSLKQRRYLAASVVLSTGPLFITGGLILEQEM